MVAATISPRHEVEIKALLRALVPAWQGLSPSRIEYLPGGYTHRNYRIDIDGGAYVLRIVAGGSVDARERRYLAIPAAPDEIAYDERQGHLLTRWIDGRILDLDRPQPVEAGAYLAHLHSQIPAGVRRYDVRAEIEALLGRAQADAGASHEEERMNAAMAEVFARFDWRPALIKGCHNDLNPWNVIRTATGGFRTLDWETAGDNDPLFDVIGLCAGLCWNVEQTAECVAAYQHDAALPHATPERIRQTIVAYQLREYAWAAAQLASGNRREEIRAQARSMHRYLMA